MESETMFNADVYCQTLLHRLWKTAQNKRRGMLTSGVVLIHGNTQPHSAALTQQLLAQFNGMLSIIHNTAQIWCRVFFTCFKRWRYVWENSTYAPKKIFKLLWKPISPWWRQPSIKRVLANSSTGMINSPVFMVIMLKNNFVDCTFVIKSFWYVHLSLIFTPPEVEKIAHIHFNGPISYVFPWWLW